MCNESDVSCLSGCSCKQHAICASLEGCDTLRLLLHIYKNSSAIVEREICEGDRVRARKPQADINMRGEWLRWLRWCQGSLESDECGAMVG